jgi:hypothetical protein
MKTLFKILLIALLIQSCEEKVEMSSVSPVNWEKRSMEPKDKDSLAKGSTYLSVYSQIYSQSDKRTHDLTATVSMHNTNRNDTIYIRKAEYFDTDGNSIRTYFDRTIFVAPMGTVQIIIDEKDKSGGTGANFIFDWMIKPGSNEPLFEAVMISTSGQQGLSFKTEGKRLK